MLTGKAKEDFVEWCKQDADWLQTYEDIFLHALIIDWLDSVGFHIAIERHIGGGADVYYAKVIYRMDNFIDTWDNIINTRFIHTVFYFSTRQEATKAAIEKANELYNETNKTTTPATKR